MMEIWKDIIGYEGLYQISNLGQVKSLDLIINCVLGYSKPHKVRILKKTFNKIGYLTVRLTKNNDRGENSVKSKLTEKQVLEIRKTHIKGYHSESNACRLAKKFNVHHNTIYNLLDRKTWKHI